MNLRLVGRFSETLPLYEEIAAYYESFGGTQALIICTVELGEMYWLKDAPKRR